MNISIPSTGTRADLLTSLEHHAAAAGVTLPKAYLTAAAAHRTLVQRSRIFLETSDPQSIAECVVDALAADRNPLSEEHVSAQALHASVVNQAPAIRNAIAKREKLVIRDHADALVSATVKVAEACYEALLHAAAEAPRFGADAPASNVLAAGTTTAAAWTAARDAQAQLDHVEKVWRVVGVKVHNGKEHLLHLAPTDVTPELLRKPGPVAWNAALLGVPLTFAGSAEGLRVREVEAEQMQLTERERQAQADRESNHAARANADSWERIATNV